MVGPEGVDSQARPSALLRCARSSCFAVNPKGFFVPQSKGVFQQRVIVKLKENKKVVGPEGVDSRCSASGSSALRLKLLLRSEPQGVLRPSVFRGIERSVFNAGHSVLRNKWWALRDLNPRPSDYESPALTN